MNDECSLGQCSHRWCVEKRNYVAKSRLARMLEVWPIFAVGTVILGIFLTVGYYLIKDAPTQQVFRIRTEDGRVFECRTYQYHGATMCDPVNETETAGDR